MAVGVVVGDVLETVLYQLREVVVVQMEKTVKFKTLLKRLEKTLKKIEMVFYEARRLSIVLDRPEKETMMFVVYLENGKELVLRCSRIKCWKVFNKFVHTNKLIRLNNELLRFFQIEAQVDMNHMMSSSMRALSGIHDLGDKMDQVLSAVTNRAGGFSGSCGVPGLPEVIVGLDQHLQEVKCRLLKDETRLLVVSAPGGCGKTTLAKLLCHDDEIKAIFGDNILYVTVSRGTSLKAIVQKLFKHHRCENYCEFQNDEEAKNQLENLMWQTGANNMLLILDDVWSESESLVEDVMFHIPGSKILVTSRFVFPRCNSTYELSLLNDEDARTLLCYSAFPCDGIHINVSDDLVNNMVKYCKGFPLALSVVGASLCGQGELKWRTMLKKWSEGESILQSNSGLLVSLQASIDALDELPIIKECFLDLGSFPEDKRIAAKALNDMWVELYNLDEEGMYTSENLLELSFRILVSLVPVRKDAGEFEGYCNEHYVTQHDLLRELAIHLSSQDPIEERKRLFVEINRNEFPTWWMEETQPIQTRLLAISTDEEFSSVWYDLEAPDANVLILNIKSKEYAMPHFIERMCELKVLNVTSYGLYPTQLHNLGLLGSLSNLKIIRLEHVSLSPFIQPIFTLPNLRKLSFITCEVGSAFKSCTTKTPYMLPILKELEFDRCYDLTELPDELCSLVGLQKLTITNCHEFEALPSGSGVISNLEILNLHCCTKLQGLPESIGRLRNLRFIDISDCLSINELPEEIGDLRALRVVKMSGCQGLRELPEGVGRLWELEDVICDEETSYLWRNYECDLSNLKINVVEEDRLGSFMKIVQ